MADEFTDGRGNPWEFDAGPPKNRSWARLFADDAELSGDRGRHERRRGVPLALRADVLSGPAAGQLGAGVDHRPGGRSGRVAVASFVHRWDRRSNAARLEPPRRHALVPVLEHVCLPDLRPVQRAAPTARPGSPVADRASSRRAVRLCAGSQRPPPGDRGRRRGQAVGRHLDPGAWRERGSGQAARGRLRAARGHRSRRSGSCIQAEPRRARRRAKIKADFKRAIRQLEQWETD